jgi:hypothetical protein
MHVGIQHPGEARSAVRAPARGIRPDPPARPSVAVPVRGRGSCGRHARPPRGGPSIRSRRTQDGRRFRQAATGTHGGAGRHRYPPRGRPRDAAMPCARRLSRGVERPDRGCRHCAPRCVGSPPGP